MRRLIPREYFLFTVSTCSLGRLLVLFDPVTDVSRRSVGSHLVVWSTEITHRHYRGQVWMEDHTEIRLPQN